MKYLRLFESVVPKVDEEQVTKYCLRFTLSSPLMMNKGSHKDDMSYEQFYNKILSYDVDIIGDLDPRTIIEYNQHMKELTSILNSEDELRAEFLSLDKKLGKCFKDLPDPLDIEKSYLRLMRLVTYDLVAEPGFYNARLFTKSTRKSRIKKILDIINGECIPKQKRNS